MFVTIEAFIHYMGKKYSAPETLVWDRRSKALQQPAALKPQSPKPKQPKTPKTAALKPFCNWPAATLPGGILGQNHFQG